MEFNLNSFFKNKKSLLILIFLTGFLFIGISTLDKSNSKNPLSLKIITNEISQNKGAVSYFLSLKPDNLGNIQIEADIIDYDLNSSKMFSIIQKDPTFKGSKENPVYQQFYPKLAYLYYSDKIFSMSANTNISYNGSTIIRFYSDAKGKFYEPGIPMQKINLLLPEEIKRKNITDFRMLIFVHDTNSESHLEFYPFDYSNTIVLFEFLNNSNVNFLVEMPKELKSHSIESLVFEENKETGQKNPTPLKEIYSGIYAISSTKKVNFETNYTRIEISVQRRFFSIETLSFFGIILITILFIIYMKHVNKLELISLYVALISIPITNYLSNRPSVTFTVPEIILVGIIVITLLVWFAYNKFKKQNVDTDGLKIKDSLSDSKDL